ncbi:hypothetical protein F751_6589 [Auxenochlorella protothecoides]|uniref:Uncharacterized protein n=1 Tax=Auxenochlorella protothecoides TaxID=3075 RepID=A0A087SPF4_AUXPR|nr:hypothetical protein F751_6589 [Auxenochlorella protothecoides]KFM27608.1 hypothetical protein F751_6589 [Auxenochlorella protothecoides]
MQTVCLTLGRCSTIPLPPGCPFPAAQAGSSSPCCPPPDPLTSWISHLPLHHPRAPSPGIFLCLAIRGLLTSPVSLPFSPKPVPLHPTTTSCA